MIQPLVNALRRGTHHCENPTKETMQRLMVPNQYVCHFSGKNLASIETILMLLHSIIYMYYGTYKILYK